MGFINLFKINITNNIGIDHKKRVFVQKTPGIGNGAAGVQNFGLVQGLDSVFESVLPDKGLYLFMAVVGVDKNFITSAGDQLFNDKVQYRPLVECEQGFGDAAGMGQ